MDITEVTLKFEGPDSVPVTVILAQTHIREVAFEVSDHGHFWEAWDGSHGYVPGDELLTLTLVLTARRSEGFGAATAGGARPQLPPARPLLQD